MKKYFGKYKKICNVGIILKQKYRRIRFFSTNKVTVRNVNNKLGRRIRTKLYLKPHI